MEAQERVEALSKELKAQAQELKTTTENYNSERILRKKYYNMIEDMKGKIRVYCRARPLSKSEKSMVHHYQHNEIKLTYPFINRVARTSQKVLTSTQSMYIALGA